MGICPRLVSFEAQLCQVYLGCQETECDCIRCLRVQGLRQLRLRGVALSSQQFQAERMRTLCAEGTVELGPSELQLLLGLLNCPGVSIAYPLRLPRPVKRLLVFYLGCAEGILGSGEAYLGDDNLRCRRLGAGLSLLQI